MELGTDAVAAELADDGIALLFCKRLDGMAHIAQVRAGLDLHDAFPHGVISDLAQPLGRNRRLAHQKHAAAVAMPAVLDARHIQIDDVAFFERLVVRHAVADLMVDRSTQ